MTKVTSMHREPEEDSRERSETCQPEGWVGTRLTRKEDRRFLAGQGRYIADLVEPTTLHAFFVRSTEAHARITRLDLSQARSMPGVVGVFTATDLPGLVKPIPLLGMPDPDFVRATRLEIADPRIVCLATDKVVYVGQPVAFVVAESRRVAEDAGEMVEIEYEPLPALVSIEDALVPKGPKIHDHLEDNLAGKIEIEFGQPDLARDQAALVISDSYKIGRQGGVPLECRGVLAKIDPRQDRVEVWTSSQIPHLVRDAICGVTDWGREEVRVVAPDVGGGFGTKANVYPEEIVIPVVARFLGMNVVWLEDRFEHLTGASTQSRDQLHKATLSVDNKGQILAWEDQFLLNVGAGSLWTAGIIANTAIHLLGPYRIPSYRCSGRAVFTNKALVAQYRGAGRPEACFALERSLDQAADKLGISRAEIRRRNLLVAGDLPYERPVPYRDGVPIRYDGGDYLKCLEQCISLLRKTTSLQRYYVDPSENVGCGIAAYIEATGRGPWETGKVTLTPSGHFEVSAGCSSAGQGHETMLSQVAADVLSVHPANIVVTFGDTDAVDEGIGSFASRTAVTAGNAVHEAAMRVLERAKWLASLALGVNVNEVEVDSGGFKASPGMYLSWRELASEFKEGGKFQSEPPLTATLRYEPTTVTWTMGVHGAVVAVDCETGQSRVLAYCVVHEGGREVNPLIVEGQLVGGVAQGIGGALLEEYRYSPEGQPLSATFADYLLPTSCDVPQVDVCHLEVATEVNALGVRGVGESGAIPVYGAIASAIEDALGIGESRIRSVPVEPAWIVANTWSKQKRIDPITAIGIVS